jgi:hypothetical protein
LRKRRRPRADFQKRAQRLVASCHNSAAGQIGPREGFFRLNILDGNVLTGKLGHKLLNRRRRKKLIATQRSPLGNVITKK